MNDLEEIRKQIADILEEIAAINAALSRLEETTESILRIAKESI